MPALASLPKWPTLHLERELGGVVCGVDEAGCAPIAGPVVAAAVILPDGPKPRQLRGLNDSKLLSPAQREKYFEIIFRIGEVGVGIASVEEIDRFNIFRADMLAMQRAVESLGRALGRVPDHALVDGRSKPALPCRVEPLVKGDRRSLSIAAASVIAKVVRDQLMQELAQVYPSYGWRSNVGYGTDVHYLGLLRQGPTEHHRRSFAPLTTLFGQHGPKLDRFSFRPFDAPPDLRGIELLGLRRDLLAVFEGNGHHVGVVKNLRGHWTFRSVGYADDQQPVNGAGPCAACHGVRLPSPARKSVVRALFEQLG